jgi:hypothetical protein
MKNAIAVYEANDGLVFAYVFVQTNFVLFSICNGKTVFFFFFLLRLLPPLCLNKLYVTHGFGNAMAQVVSHWPHTTQARVHAWVGPRDICGGQSGTGKSFALSPSFFPVSIISPLHHIYL